MKQRDYTVSDIPTGHEVWDVDIAPDGRVACILASPPDARAEAHLRRLPLASIQPVLFIDGRVLPVPLDSTLPYGSKGHIHPPHLRWAGPDRLIVFRRSADNHEINLWVMTTSGEVDAKFHAGDAIQDVLANESRIVVTYFDEGILGGTALDSLVVLDLRGGLISAYSRDMPARDRLQIFDCHCACWSETDEVILRPYAARGLGRTFFPLVRWNFSTMTQEVFETPHRLDTGSALTSADDRIYFHTDRRVEEWTIGSPTCSTIEVGIPRHQLRGLPGGRFIGIRPEGYSLLSFNNE